MKIRLFIVLSLLAVSSMFLSSCAILKWFGGSNKGGWEGYMEALQKQNPGLNPYWIPNSDDGPGTILEMQNGSEQLYLSAKYSFPNLKPDISSVPSSFVSEVSAIQFNLGAKGQDRQVLPGQVEAATSMAYTGNTEMTLSIHHPKLYRISNALLTNELRKFDITDPLQEDILNKLMEPNVRLISGAVSSNGFIFTFNNVLKLDANLEASLMQKLASADLKYKRMDETRFSVKADTMIFLAYYAYPVNIADLKSLHADLHRAHELKVELKRIDSAKSDLQAHVEALNTIQKDGGGTKGIQSELSYEYFAYQKTLDSLYQVYVKPAPMGGNNSSEIKKQIVDLQKKLGLATEDQKELQKQITEWVSKYYSAKQKYNELNNKQYSLFGDTAILVMKPPVPGN